MIIGILRIGIIIFAVSIAWDYMSALIKSPVSMFQESIAVVVMLVIGFGSIIYVPDFLPFENDLVLALIWVGGSVAALFAAELIGGFDHGPNKDVKYRTPETPLTMRKVTRGRIQILLS